MSIDKTFLRLEQVKQNLSRKYEITMEQIMIVTIFLISYMIDF